MTQPQIPPVRCSLCGAVDLVIGDGSANWVTWPCAANECQYLRPVELEQMWLWYPEPESLLNDGRHWHGRWQCSQCRQLLLKLSPASVPQ